MKNFRSYCHRGFTKTAHKFADSILKQMNICGAD